MPDKSYIKKVYDFMNNAYGDSGSVSRGAFTMDFDKFYDRVSSNPKYADKIYGALSTAYGPGGVYKPDAFTLDADAFRGRVLTPKQEPVAEQFPAAKEMLSFTGQYPKGENPANAVLKSAADLQVPEKTEPGYLQDIKGFDPAIKATEVLNQAQREQGKRMGEKYLLNNTPAEPINMQQPSPKEIVDQQLSNPNVQYQNHLKVALEK